MRIVSAGEGLVDLVATGSGTYLPVAGGSPLNVATGLRRLGVAAAWLGRRSTGAFGDVLGRHLASEGIDTAFVQMTGAPTSLAVVDFDGGQPRYDFYLEGTTNTGWDGPTPPLAPEDVLHVGFGAVRAHEGALGVVLAALVEREHGQRVITLDPNVRPVAGQRTGALREAIERLVKRSDLVKVSVEDLRALDIDDVEGTAAGWARHALVVLTFGAGGAVAFAREGVRVAIAARPVEVVDAVGAGDATMAGLLAWLADHHALDPERIRALSAAELHAMVDLGVRCASVSCMRTGADPPTRTSLAEFP